MGEKLRLDKAARWEELIGQRTRSGIWPRLRHALWAGLIAYAFFYAAFLGPFDQILWSIESRLHSARPSGDVVFVGASRDLADPSTPARRSELAQVLRKLDRAGAERIYVDFVFDERGSSAHDAALAEAVSELGSKLVFVADFQEFPDGTVKVERSLAEIRGSASEAVNPDYSKLLNISWVMPYYVSVGGETFPTLANLLSGSTPQDRAYIAVDYKTELAEFPTMTFKEVVSASEGTAAAKLRIAGKHVVVAPGFSSPDNATWIPGHRNIPQSFVAIYAAETARAGNLRVLPPTATFLILLLAVFAAAGTAHARARRTAYVAICLSFPTAILAGAFLNIRLEIAHPALIVLLYSMMRLRAFWQRRVSLRDEETGMPTLRALEEQLGKARGPGYVVVAKIHGYERVLKLIPTTLKSTYLLKIAERLKASEADLILYSGAQYFAWISAESDQLALEEHLNGLRALFGAPLDIAGTPVDVGITFGSARIGATREHSLPAAMAAVEDTSEAHEPVVFAVERSQDENLWDISMRARIDAAMNNGEVYCLYQPKYSLDSNLITGIEALVRWDDSERGPIPPMTFIKESEKAGRMEQLTRYVLQSACTAGRLLHSRGHRISVSVNVSAIMCSDTGIVRLVEEALKASGFPADYLVLEVTETARIRDLSSAAHILGQLKRLGIKLSIDDFGVGMANYETFYELPFDELKIDRLFIKNIRTDSKARAIASSLIAMGTEARIAITAEGVEDPEDLQILKDIGCSQVQGYAISRPITLSNLLDFLERRRKNMV